MILNNAPQDQAVLSNVGEIGEFRIRNSAKAFSILSSGLYANKVRAIIRELSCNAVDSHVAAGKPTVAFDVHLPNSLEPYFSIRDFGIGLSHNQVTQIYTTYFESTKTASNEFIGALGLGSKSPFSYTDNFTVTAVQNGRKGIYTAFINESGVPSIALMMEEFDVSEPNGVEVKFSVNERYDFDKFRQEARNVYKFFKVRPNISGNSTFEFTDPDYQDTNIVAGVHTTSDFRSYAIMGNISYPIEIPEASVKDLGEDLSEMLECGLVIEFGIGELDFQASREGLSYVPLTIQSIKRKLESVSEQLSVFIAQEADAIDNLWTRAIYLSERRNKPLWKVAAEKYITDSKFTMIDISKNSWNRINPIKLTTQDIATKYNAIIRGFQKNRGQVSSSNLKAASNFDKATNTHFSEWSFSISADSYFVFNTTKVGATERAKHHWRNRKMTSQTENVFVIDAVDKTKPINKKELLAALLNPPEVQIMNTTDLDEKQRKTGIGRNVSILKLREREGRGRSNDDLVWVDAGKLEDFAEDEIYYYVPLSGYTSLGKTDVKTLYVNLNRSKLYTGEVYGVRKGDMESIEDKDNWKLLDDMIVEELGKVDTSNVMGMVKSNLNLESICPWNFGGLVPADSPYQKLFNVFKDVQKDNSTVRSSLSYLFSVYDVKTVNADPSALVAKYEAESTAVRNRYPLLPAVNRYSVTMEQMADYVNMVDATLGK